MDADFPKFEVLGSDLWDMLDEVYQKVVACKRCNDLCYSRKNVVFGEGPTNAKIMIIGEAPGADEDNSGRPFVGRAGVLLTNILSAAEIDRSQCYVCNILKCRPPKNRTPTDEESNNCREYLDQQIDTIAPKYILCLGATAATQLLGTNATITALRGKWHSYKNSHVLCTYHPSYAMRCGDIVKKQIWNDLKILLSRIEET